MINVELQTDENIVAPEINFWQTFHAVTVAIQKAAHSETAVYQAYNEQIKKLGLYSSISWVDETGDNLEVASIVPPRGVEFLLAKRPMVGTRFPLDKIPITHSVIQSGRAVYRADVVSLLFNGRLNPLIKLWPAAPRFMPHIPVIITPLYRGGRSQGVLYLAGKNITPNDLDAVTALGHHLSVALDNARLFQTLQKDIARRQRVEASLRQSEEQFRILAENVPGVIYLCRNDPRFTVIYVNKAIEELTGYPKEMFLENKISFVELYHPEDAPFINVEEESSLRERGSFHHVYRIKHRSGEWRWVEEVGSGVFDEQGDLLFLEGVITDITERRQSELAQNTLYRIAAAANTGATLDELFASIHQILGNLVDARNFYIAIYNPESDSISFPYFVDEKDSVDGGRPAGNGLTEYVAQSNAPHLLTAADIGALEKKGRISVRGSMPQIWLGVPLSLPNGTVGVIAMQSYANPQAYTEKDKQLLQFVSGQIAAAIHRKQTESQLRTLTRELQQQAKIRDAILATTPSTFSVVDRNGRFLFISRIDQKDWQLLDTGQAVGKTWRELGIPEEIGIQGDRDRRKAFRTGQPVTRELALPDPDGPMHLEYVLSPVREADGNIPYLVVTARDITEQKKAAEALYHTQKMESLGILAGGIAHDFNNLLVAMLAQTSLALAQLPPDAAATPHVEKAMMAAESAAALTRQLLAYSGRGQFHTALLDLNQLIRENNHLIHVTLGKNVRLQLNLAGDLPPIEADAGQIQQIIMNLIINAAEAIGASQGTITVTTRTVTLTPETVEEWPGTAWQLAPGLYVQLTVEDDGPGMDEQTLNQIFDPFFTTKFTGRGLGLAAVSGIVRSHKGGLRVTSRPRQGAKFELIFPASDEAIQERVVMNKPSHPDSPKVVLVIDDEESVREAVSDILDMEGITVLQAANGQKGIDIYQSRQAEIDLILLDLSMPGLSGEDTLKKLRQINPQVRVLLSSGYSESDVTFRLDQSGLVGFLQKPYHMNTLLEEVGRCLNAA